jgi:hypothetical protein
MWMMYLISFMPKIWNLNWFVPLKHFFTPTINDKSNYITEYWRQCLNRIFSKYISWDRMWKMNAIIYMRDEIPVHDTWLTWAIILSLHVSSRINHGAMTGNCIYSSTVCCQEGCMSPSVEGHIIGHSVGSSLAYSVDLIDESTSIVLHFTYIY